MPETERSSVDDNSATPEEIREVNRAFDMLYAGLREAKRNFENGAESGREGVLQALQAAIIFLTKFRIVVNGGLHAPFLKLLEALSQLEEGESHPLLRAQKFPGRKKSDNIRQSIIGATVYTVSRLTTCGLTLPNAHKEVSTILQNAGVRSGRGRFKNITKRTIRGWCEKVAEDVGNRETAAQTIIELEKSAIGPEAGTTAAEQQRFYLGQLADLCQKLRADEPT
jgi:hypothetical protein